MARIATVLIGIVAILHLWFLVLEMFLWQTEVGLQTFNMTPEVAAITATLAKNQGLYNGFLAAGLIWTLFVPEEKGKRAIQTFFLLCIIIAGVYGALTAKSTILYVQALPALLALIPVRLQCFIK